MSNNPSDRPEHRGDVLYESEERDEHGRVRRKVWGPMAGRVVIAAIAAAAVIVLAVLAVFQGIPLTWPPWPIWFSAASAVAAWTCRRRPGG